MTTADFNSLAGGFESIATISALLVGAYWTYTRFVRQREDHALVDFTADIEFIGKHDNWWIVELTSNIENKGKVQHRISEFAFDLYAINCSDPIELNEEFGGQVHFPHLVTKGSWMPKKYNSFFIDPGTKAKYSFITRIPTAAQFVIIHSWFSYNERGASHAAERTVQVPV